MSVRDYGGNGMCGPRCVLRTFDEAEAFQYYQHLLEWSKINKKYVLDEVIKEHFSQGKDPSFFIDALKSKESLAIYFGDGGSTTSLFMVMAAFERNECYVINEHTFGSIIVNIKGKDNRMFRGLNGHWVELV